MFDAAAAPDAVRGALSARYTVLAESSSAARWTFLDTADWRLHRKGITLRDARLGRRGQLVLSNGSGEPVFGPAPAGRWPRRIDAVPASPVRERIVATVGPRALLPLAEVSVRSTSLRLLDDQDKTRVRVQVDEQRLEPRADRLPLRVLISPLRGYERDAQRCTDLLRAALAGTGLDATSAEFAMSAAGCAPGQPPVAAPHLDPAAPAVTSLAAVLRHWIDVIDAVWPGVVADVDIEYLHDMRTSLRATRSLINISREILPAEQLAGFAAEFAWLGQLTTPLRDLDVFCYQLSPDSGRDLTGLENLDALREYLAAQRLIALRALRRGLDSPDGATLVARWRAELERLAGSAPADRTTREVAGRQARAAYRRILGATETVTGLAAPEDLHRLRRQCKRMRYLLDAYGTVFAPEPQRAVLRSLKALQDCLGDIQDVDVQRRYLADLADVVTRRTNSAQAAVTIGGLRERILAADAQARQVLEDRLARFVAPKTRRRVRDLGREPASAGR